MSIRLLLLILALLPAAYAGSQPAYHLTTYTNENGLPTNSIKGMEYDTASGLLWLGTEAGIIRFNGYDFKSYLREPVRIFNTTRDRDGRICFIGETNDLYVLRQGEPVFLKRDRRIPPGTLAKGKELPYICPDWIMPLAGGREGYLYQQDSTVYFDDDHTVVPVVSQIGPCSFFRSADAVLICTAGSLYRFDRAGKKAVRIAIEGLPPGRSASARIITNINTPHPAMLAGTGLWLLDCSGGSCRARLVCNDLPEANDIAAVRIIEGGNLIIAANRTKGLLVLRRKSIRSVAAADGRKAADYVMYGQAQVAPNTIATNTGVIVDPSGAEPPVKGPATVYNLYTTRDGIWYSRMDTLFRYSPASRRTVSVPLRDGSEWTIFAEAEGQLYAISNAGIYTLSAAGAAKVLPLPAFVEPGDRSAYAAAISIAPSVVAIAARNQLLLFHTKRRTLDSVVITRHAAVRALWQHGDYLFIGTYGNGIFCLKNGLLRPLPLDKNGYLRYTHCFLPDSSGHLWMSTNNGLFEASIAAMCAAWADGTRGVYYYYFGKKDGLRMTELNGGCQPCALQTEDGTFSFPSMDGLAWIRPGEALTLLPKGHVVVDGMSVSTHSSDDIPVVRPDKLPPDVRSITIAFTIPYWGNLQNLYAQYRLSGYDESWTPLDAGISKSVTFSELPHGHYVFELRVFRGFEPDAVSSYRIPFTIPTPWYLSWWFCCIGALVFAMLLRLFVRWRLHHIRRKNIQLERTIAERTSELAEKVAEMQRYQEALENNNTLKGRLISIISHNIITPLRYMHRAGTALRNEREKLSTTLQEKAADSITETSRELELLAVNMLNWIRFQHDNPDLKAETFRISAVLQHVLDISRPVAREKSLHIVCRNEQDATVFQFKDAIRVILYNLVINAVNYSTSGTVSIRVTAQGGSIRIAVSDEGIGMEQAQIDKLLSRAAAPDQSRELENKGQGLGYLIIRDLLRIIKGTLDIRSAPGQGTCATVTFSDL